MFTILLYYHCAYVSITFKYKVNFLCFWNKIKQEVSNILKAITWNIKAGKNYNGTYPLFKTKNLSKIAKVIIKSDASIVCLQEVDILTIRSGRIHQLEFIKNILEYHTMVPWFYSFSPSVKLLSGYYGNAIISKLPLTPILNTILPKVNSNEYRSFLLARVEYNYSYIHLGTFHLGLKGDQIIQAKKIKEILSNLGYPDKKILIGGDMNDIKNSKTYKTIQNYRFNLQDTGPDTCTFQCYKNNKNKKIDFWFSKNLLINPSKCQVLKIDISDHRPVLVSFSI